jgi:hypothetical protein
VCVNVTGRDVELNHNIIDNPAKMSAPLSGNRTLGFYLVCRTTAYDYYSTSMVFGLTCSIICISFTRLKVFIV